MKQFLWVLLVLLVASTGFAQSGTVSEQFKQVADLRSRGEYDAAIDVLTKFIDLSSQSDDVLRRAYNQLVWTIVVKSEDLNERARQTGDSRLNEELDELARTLGRVVGNALTQFPDIRAGDDIPDPSRVNQRYEPARQRMFGALVLVSDPDSAQVWINDEETGWTHTGWTPLRRNLFPIGDYEIKLSREDHRDKSLTARIRPNETKEYNVPLQRKRSKAWWLTRVVVPSAGAIGILVYALTSGDDASAQEPVPLQGPPDPPE